MVGKVFVSGKLETANQTYVTICIHAFMQDLTLMGALAGGKTMGK